MKFSFINLFNGLILLLILIPNILWAIKHPEVENKCKNVFFNLAEQIGRYSCMFLMIFPLFVWKFGFRSVSEMIIHFAGGIFLTLIYLAVWVYFFKNSTDPCRIILAVVPCMIFFLFGFTLRHWALSTAAVVFFIGHIGVTLKNIKSKK